MTIIRTIKERWNKPTKDLNKALNLHRIFKKRFKF